MNTREIIVRNHQILSFSKMFSATSQGDSVFWPGCAVLSMGKELSEKTYLFLKEWIPDLGYSTTCCGKPSKHINGGKDFEKRKAFLISTFEKNKIKTIYTLCPNCYNTLSEFEQVQVKSIWSIVDEHFPEDKRGILKGQSFSLHDPCPIVKDIESTDHVRSILQKMGAEILEFKNNREKTICCGKKNMIMALEPEKGQKIFNARAAQAPSRNIVTYCASCKDTFKQNEFEAHHLLELLFQVETGASWVNRYKAVKNLERVNRNA